MSLKIEAECKNSNRIQSKHALKRSTLIYHKITKIKIGDEHDIQEFHKSDF